MTQRKPLFIVAGIIAIAAAVAAVLLLTGSSGGRNKLSPQVVATSDDIVSEAPSAEDPPPDEAPSEKPTVLPQADKVTGKKIKPDPKQTTPPPVKDPIRDDATGCDYGYGEGGLPCVPYRFPKEIETPGDKCAYLLDQGFPQNIKVKKDRHRLDPDGNKVACDGALKPEPYPSDPL